MKQKHKGSRNFILSKKEVKKEKKSSKIKIWLNFLFVIFAALVLGFGLVQFCMQTIYMTGPSMQPTLSDGDEVVLNKLAYKFGKIHRYDIVAIKKIGSTDYYDVKRVVGPPGDTISVVAGRLVINGKQVSEERPFAFINSAGVLTETVTLGDEEYFCIGDNTSNSEDSRYINYGNVQKSEIKGKITYRVNPEELRGKLDAEED